MAPAHTYTPTYMALPLAPIKGFHTNLDMQVLTCCPPTSGSIPMLPTASTVVTKIKGTRELSTTYISHSQANGKLSLTTENRGGAAKWEMIPRPVFLPLLFCTGGPE